METDAAPSTVSDKSALRYLIAFVLVLTTALLSTEISHNGASRFLLGRALYETSSVEIEDYVETLLAEDRRLGTRVMQGTLDHGYMNGRKFSEKSPGAGFLVYTTFPAFHWLSENVFGVKILPKERIPDKAYAFFIITLVALIGGVPLAVIYLLLTSTKAPWKPLTRWNGVFCALLLLSTNLLYSASKGIFSHVAAGAALLAALYFIFSRASHRSLLLAGLCTGLAILFEYLTIPAAGLLALCALVYRTRVSFLFCVGPIAAFALIAWYHTQTTGAVSDPPYLTAYSEDSPSERMSSAEVASIFVKAMFSEATLSNAARILFYPYRGQFFFNPILLLGVWGFFLLWKRGMYALAIIPWFFFLLLVWLTATKPVWWVWWWYGSRYLGAALPLLLIPVGVALNELFLSQRRKALIHSFVVLLMLLGLLNSASYQRPHVVLPSSKSYSSMGSYWRDLRDTNQPVLREFIPGVEYHLENHLQPLFRSGVELPLWEVAFGGKGIYPYLYSSLAALWSLVILIAWRERKRTP